MPLKEAKLVPQTCGRPRLGLLCIGDFSSAGDTPGSSLTLSGLFACDMGWEDHFLSILMSPKVPKGNLYTEKRRAMYCTKDKETTRD
jgi:hypothetical protein